jgi:hypothetical protein
VGFILFTREDKAGLAAIGGRSRVLTAISVAASDVFTTTLFEFFTANLRFFLFAI